MWNTQTTGSGTHACNDEFNRTENSLLLACKAMDKTNFLSARVQLKILSAHTHTRTLTYIHTHIHTHSLRTQRSTAHWSRISGSVDVPCISNLLTLIHIFAVLAFDSRNQCSIILREIQTLNTTIPCCYVFSPHRGNHSLVALSLSYLPITLQFRNSAYTHRSLVKLRRITE